jgi:hypothetical protein
MAILDKRIPAKPFAMLGIHAPAILPPCRKWGTAASGEAARPAGTSPAAWPFPLATSLGNAPMSSFGLYVIGFIILAAGMIYGAWLLHVPQSWIIVGALVVIGLGVMSAVSHTRRRDPPTEPPAP